jgi:hypothetical protein
MGGKLESPSANNGCPPGNTRCNGYPYGNDGLMARHLIQSAKAPSQPWCSRPKDIAKKQYMTYSFPTTVSGGMNSTGGMKYTKIMSSNSQFLGIW